MTRGDGSPRSRRTSRTARSSALQNKTHARKSSVGHPRGARAETSGARKEEHAGSRKRRTRLGKSPAQAGRRDRLRDGTRPPGGQARNDTEGLRADEGGSRRLEAHRLKPVPLEAKRRVFALRTRRRYAPAKAKRQMPQKFANTARSPALQNKTHARRSSVGHPRGARAETSGARKEEHAGSRKRRTRLGESPAQAGRRGRSPSVVRTSKQRPYKGNSSGGRAAKFRTRSKPRATRGWVAFGCARP